ncbi:hypothetical protein NSP_34230 [Nodularia spumigena CCY9414]|nr:hypothetical protein NSP_34230 [Nodularia spumigena CCY9414]
MSVRIETFPKLSIKTVIVVRLKTPGIPSPGVLLFLSNQYSQKHQISYIIDNS